MRKIPAILAILIITLCGCAPEPPKKNFDDLAIVGSMDLRYAQQFNVDYLADGCSLISINESGRYLLVPAGQTPPLQVAQDITVLSQPLENIYLAATSAMCLFDALEGLEQITLSGTKAEGWYIENARTAMETGAIVYAGKYSAPDYELLLTQNCGLAIESTMINHVPNVKEKLESLGIPVMVERSSYEPHPLGRTEWIKLYGLLLNKNEAALKLFTEQTAYIDSIPPQKTEKSVAFFYISSSGSAVVRKSGDYIAKMIELAGGIYVFSDLGNADSAAGAVNLEMERFYAAAVEADIIIYNSSIDGEIHSIDELLAKNHLLADFKAVKNGNIWCTGKNFFQETTGFGLVIWDMYRIFNEDLAGLDELNYLYRLR